MRTLNTTLEFNTDKGSTGYWWVKILRKDNTWLYAMTKSKSKLQHEKAWQCKKLFIGPNLVDCRENKILKPVEFRLLSSNAFDDIKLAHVLLGKHEVLGYDYRV